MTKVRDVTYPPRSQTPTGPPDVTPGRFPRRHTYDGPQNPLDGPRCPPPSSASPPRLAILAVAAVGASLALPQSTAHAAGATTYYVSPAGSDSNSGTSPGSAIQTLGRASGLQLNPGDQVLLQRGATFSGKLAVWKSGTAGAPITIGAYGSGNKPGRDRRLPRGRRLLHHDDRLHRRVLHAPTASGPTAPAT